MKKSLLLILPSFSLCAKAQTEKEYLQRAHKTNLYITIYSDVHQVMVDIQLAKDGTIKKYQVVNEYNNLLGKYLGNKDTFKGVSAVIIKKGDALIKYTLLKCAARLALEDAAEKSN